MKKQDIEDLKIEIAGDFAATEYQREKANEDIRFCMVDGGMWEGYLEHTHYQDSSRARLELDIVSDHVERFIGEWTDNRVNVSFTPDDEATTDDDAELLNGIYRADFKDNGGQTAQDTAVKEVAYCGVGHFKISPRYDDEEDPDSDRQQIFFKGIHNSYNHVIWDKNAKEVDKSDARRCTVLWAYTDDAYAEQWPNGAPVSAYTPDSRRFLNWSYNDTKIIYVAERYDVEIERTTIHIFENWQTGQIERIDARDLEMLEQELRILGFREVRRKRVKIRTVYRCVFSGEDYLEQPKRIAGKWIPIIPMYGYRMFVDGEEYFRGCVRKLKDVNRMINASVSRMTETAATSPEDKPIFTRAQVQGLEHVWADQTEGAYAMINDLVDAEGNPVFNGPVGWLSAPQVDPNSQAITEIGFSFAQKMTGHVDADSPAQDQRSGKLLQELNKRENRNTKTITDNIKTSIKHSGRVYRSIAAEVLADRRQKRVLSADMQTTKMVQLRELFMDQETGTFQERNNLSKGRYQVDVDVGPQYESQKEATIESIERVIERLPEGSPYLAPLLAMWIDNIVGTGLDPLKDFNRKQMLVMGMVKPEDQDEMMYLVQQMQQPDPDAELKKAVETQQHAEAEHLQAKTVQTLADANKKKVEAAQIIDEIGANDARLALEQIGKPQRFVFNPETRALEHAGSRTTRR